MFRISTGHDQVVSMPFVDSETEPEKRREALAKFFADQDPSDEVVYHSEDANDA